MSINHPDLRNIVQRQHLELRGPDSSLMLPAKRETASSLDVQSETSEIETHERTYAEKIKRTLGMKGTRSTVKQPER